MCDCNNEMKRNKNYLYHNRELNHYFFILWPKISKDKCTFKKEEEGYVIGWQDSDADDSHPRTIHETIDNDNKNNNNNNNDVSIMNSTKNRHKIRYSTMICIGVIPSKLYSSYYVLQEALLHIQQKLRQSSSSSNDLKDLKVLAYFQPHAKKYNDDRNHFQNLPILTTCDYKIVPISTKSNNSKNKNKNDPISIVAFDNSYCPYSQQSVVFYDPCNINPNNNARNLEHYHHYQYTIKHDSSSTFHLKDVDETPKRQHSDIHGTLTRINYGQFLYHQLLLHQIATTKLTTHTQKHDPNTHVFTVDSNNNSSPKKTINSNNDVVVQSSSPSSSSCLNHTMITKENINDTSGSIQLQHENFVKTTNDIDNQTTTITNSKFINFLTLIRQSSFIFNHWDYYCRCGWDGYPPLLSCVRQLLHWYIINPINKENENSHFLPRFQNSQIQLQMANRMALLVFDGVVGVYIGIVLIRYSNWINLHIVNNAVFFFQETLLCQNVKWLQTIPAGFKLNTPLTHNMTSEILQMVTMYKQFVTQFIFPTETVVIWLIKSFGSLSSVLGITFFLTVIMDTIQLLTLHTSLVLATPFRWTFRQQLQLFNSLWHLFRGKKIDVLRSRRSDSLRYDSIQLLLGMVLFMMCLFLLTTIWVYYIFFVLLNLFVQGIVLSMVWWTYFIILNFPFGSLYYRFTQPKRFSKNIYFQRIDATTNLKPVVSSHDEIRLFEIGILFESPTSILVSCYSSGITHVLKSLPNLLLNIATGQPYSITKTFIEAIRKREH